MIAVVIPCHRVRKHVLAVLAAIGPEVGRVYLVDDACPEGTAGLVEAESPYSDPRKPPLNGLSAGPGLS